MTRLDAESRSRRQRLRTLVAAGALAALAVLMYLLIEASLDPGPPSTTVPHTTLPPRSTHLVIPTVPPLRVPPVEPG